jgi:hypothetical protein
MGRGRHLKRYSVIAITLRYVFALSYNALSQQNKVIISKAGHPQFKSAPPQLRNIADNQNDCGVADLKKVAEL